MSFAIESVKMLILLTKNPATLSEWRGMNHLVANQNYLGDYEKLVSIRVPAEPSMIFSAVF